MQCKMWAYVCLFELYWHYSAWMYMVSVPAYVWLKLPDCVADIFVVILIAETEIFHKAKPLYTENF
jgi:hypothetical protein